MTQPVYTVSDFVAVCNQVLDVSFGHIQITGEVSQFKISKNRWVYFDLKDDYANLRFWGSIYVLPGPIEDGMKVLVHGVPQMHPKFGFSVSIQAIELVGEGTIKKAAQLLEAKLEKEGLFASERKRRLPYPPAIIGLITSQESAAYADFTKIIGARWPLVTIMLADVQVQGERAVNQIVSALNHFNELPSLPDVLVVIRGGGSMEDLQAYNSEQITRAIAACRIPTLVAIGHETDISLAERAADQRASTPSNAAEILVPDKLHELQSLDRQRKNINDLLQIHNQQARSSLMQQQDSLENGLRNILRLEKDALNARALLVEALSPTAVLDRGFTIVRQGGKVVTSARALKKSSFEIQFKDGRKRVQ